MQKVWLLARGRMEAPEVEAPALRGVERRVLVHSETDKTYF